MIISHSQTDFHEVGIQWMDNAETLGHQLGQITVREWKDHYAGFLVDTDMKEAADNFLQCGYSDSQLGDTVVLASANALGTIFTTVLTKSHILIYLEDNMIQDIDNCTGPW